MMSAVASRYVQKMYQVIEMCTNVTIKIAKKNQK